MKLDMESKEIKNIALNAKNKTDSQNKKDSVVETSAASTSQEVVAVKQQESKEVTADVLGLQNTDSNSENLVVSSTSELNSSECQDCEVPSETHLNDAFNLVAAEVEEVLKPQDSEICIADESSVKDSDNTPASTSQLNCNESCLTEVPSEENLIAPEESKCIISIKDSEKHRQNTHYSSESSDFETDESSDSSDCEGYMDNLRKSMSTKVPVLKTPGELLFEDLPPVEDLHITVPSTELVKIGCILHWVVAEERKEFLVIVESDGNSNPLDEDSVLFLSPDKPLGKIHDVFGNVSKPKYVVRFNNADDIFNKDVTTGQIVYYSPGNGDLTRYVLVDVLKKQKGSDASWKDNNEPPDDEIDYSDDEQEKLAKQKRRSKTRGKERNWNNAEGEDVAPNKMQRRDAVHSQRAFKRPSRNVFQSRSPGPSRSLTRPFASQNFGSPSDNFGSSGLRRNAVSPQPFGLNSSNSSPFQPFLPRNVPPPQPFGQFPHSNVPSPQPLGPPPHRSAPSPQPFGPPSHRGAPSPQPFGPPSHRGAPSPQPFGPPQLRNAPSPQPFGPPLHHSAPSSQPFTVPATSYVLAPPNLVLSHATGAFQSNPSSHMSAPQNNVPFQQPSDNFGSSALPRNAVSPGPFGVTSNSIHFLQRNVPPPQLIGQFPHSQVPSPQLFGQLPYRNAPAPQPFGQLPHHNSPSPQPFGQFPHNNAPSQSFGQFLQNNVPSQSFGPLQHSNVPSSQPFSPSTMSSYQPFTVPSSYVSASHNTVLSYARGVPQVNPSFLMAAPQNNVPLQQQLLLQSHQQMSTLSRAPHY